MLPMRPITPAHASIASLSVVLPDDAWPTMAKFRRSSAEGVGISQIRSSSKQASNLPRAQAEISGSKRRTIPPLGPAPPFRPTVPKSNSFFQDCKKITHRRQKSKFRPERDHESLCKSTQTVTHNHQQH